MPGLRATLVECQEDWRPHLESNIARFGEFAAAAVVFWGTVGAFHPGPGDAFDLIVANPPYFDPGRGRPAPDPRRNTAHRFVLEGWDAWRDCMVRSLAVGGEAWWLQKDPGPVGAKWEVPLGYELAHVVRTGEMRLLRLRRLHVE